MSVLVFYGAIAIGRIYSTSYWTPFACYYMGAGYVPHHTDHQEVAPKYTRPNVPFSTTGKINIIR